jgi:hypothetical protein
MGTETDRLTVDHKFNLKLKLKLVGRECADMWSLPVET